MDSELAEALVAVQLEITNAPTNAENPFFKSRYTDLATAVNHCRPILAKHGLAIVQTFGGTAEEPIIFTTLIHKSGQVFTSDGLCMKPVKPDPQAVGSLLTYGRRYSYLAMVGIAPEDDDANKASGKGDKKQDKKADKGQKKQPEEPKVGDMISGPQLTKLNTMISEATLDRENVKKLLRKKWDIKLESFKHLTAGQTHYVFDNWHKLIDTYGKEFPK